MLRYVILIVASLLLVEGVDIARLVKRGAPQGNKGKKGIDGAGAVCVVPMNGHGGPQGRHEYLLNVICVPEGRNKEGCDHNGCKSNGKRIFIPCKGKTTTINLKKGTTFQVNDYDGTDGEAEFELPDPNADNICMPNQTDPCQSDYSIFTRPLGKPGGEADVTLCQELLDGTETYCSTENQLNYSRKKGKSSFVNVTAQLLYIYVWDEDDQQWLKYPLFDSVDHAYWWEWTNNDLKIAQLRFYECDTIIPGVPATATAK